MAKNAQDTFSVGIINTGYLAKCVEDNKAYKRSEFANIKVRWKPAFDIDATMLSGIGDGVMKINHSVSDYFDKSTLEDLTGINASSYGNPAYEKPLEINVNSGEENEQICIRRASQEDKQDIHPQLSEFQEDKEASGSHK